MDHSSFEVLGTRRVADLAFLTVDREFLMGPGGWVTRDVVRHPGSVVVVPWDGERVTFIRQFRAAVGRTVLELPAGKLDVAGEPPADTAVREAIEEIGRLPRRLTLLHTSLASPGFTDEISYIFLAEDLESVASDPQGLEEEVADVVEWDLDDVEQALADGVFEDSTTLIGVLALLRLLGR